MRSPGNAKNGHSALCIALFMVLMALKAVSAFTCLKNC
jgi:hypothetical protein